MKGTIILGLLMLLLATSLTAKGKKADSKDIENEITIGYLGSLTGNLANYGTLQSQAARMAVADFQQENPDIKIKLVVEDTAGRTERATQAVEKLINVDKIIALIGPTISGVGLAIAPRLQQAKVVTISASVSAADFTNMGDYIFRTQVSDVIQANVLGRYVYRNLKLKTVAVLYTENDYSQPLAQRFKEVYEQAGGKIVSMQSSLEGDKDFKAQLTKIAQLKPEGLFLPNYAVELAQMLRQARQLELQSKFLSSDGFSNPDNLTLAQKDALGVIFSGPTMQEDKDSTDDVSNFSSRYNEQFGVEPDNFSYNAYDATNLVLTAITKLSKSKDGVSRVALQKEIAATNAYQGVSGEIAFNNVGDVMKDQAILTTVADANGLPKYQQIGVYKLAGDILEEVK